ncbi:unnamed protein product [Lota lota]
MRNSEKLTLIDIKKVCPGSAGQKQPWLAENPPEESVSRGHWESGCAREPHSEQENVQARSSSFHALGSRRDCLRLR